MSGYPPGLPPQPLNYAQPKRNDLREIATRQRILMFCILGYIAVFVLQFVLPPPLRIVLGLLALVVVITATVYVFMLAIAVCNTGAGIVLGILTLIPLVGLITLLIVNGKATAILKQNG